MLIHKQPLLQDYICITKGKEMFSIPIMWFIINKRENPSSKNKTKLQGVVLGPSQYVLILKGE